jgi:hypothetical protein
MTLISVTAEHIARGEPDSCRFCPVALAINGAFPDAGLIAVDGDHVALCDGPSLSNNWIELDMPDPARRFIEAFDQGGHVEPFTFELDYQRRRHHDRRR